MDFTLTMVNDEYEKTLVLLTLHKQTHKLVRQGVATSDYSCKMWFGTRTAFRRRKRTPRYPNTKGYL